MKLVDEYRRRALAVRTLADGGMVSDEERRELRIIARLWERLAVIRERRLESERQGQGNE